MKKHVFESPNLGLRHSWKLDVWTPKIMILETKIETNLDLVRFWYLDRSWVGLCQCVSHAFGWFLDDFWRSKFDEKSCFLGPRFFIKKMNFFKTRRFVYTKLSVFEGQGRFWRFPEPSKIGKSHLWKPKKTLFRKKQKKHEFSKKN